MILWSIFLINAVFEKNVGTLRKNELLALFVFKIPVSVDVIVPSEPEEAMGEMLYSLLLSVCSVWLSTLHWYLYCLNNPVSIRFGLLEHSCMQHLYLYVTAQQQQLFWATYQVYRNCIWYSKRCILWSAPLRLKMLKDILGPNCFFHKHLSDLSVRTPELLWIQFPVQAILRHVEPVYSWLSSPTKVIIYAKQTPTLNTAGGALLLLQVCVKLLQGFHEAGQECLSSD